MKKATGWALALLLCTVSAAFAAPLITVGDHDLLPNTYGQEIQIFVTGGDLVQGLVFYAQVADGGPETAAKGLIPLPGILGPEITELDLIDGTIFADDNTGRYVWTGEVPQFGWASVTTAGTVDPVTLTTTTSFVSTEGLLATITISTETFNTIGESWELKITETLDGVGIPDDEGTSTHFIGQGGGEDWIFPNVTNGSIRIVAPVLSSADPGTWSDLTTWDDGTVAPTAIHAVEVGPHAVEVATDGSAYSLTISDAAGSVAISSGNTLSIDDDATVAAGSLNVEATAVMSVKGDLAIAAGAEFVTQVGATAAGVIDVTGEADLAGTLKFEVTGGSPFQFGEYTLMTSGSFSEGFESSEGLNKYVTPGDENDHLDYSGGALKVLIDYNLNDGDANLDTVTDVRDFNLWNANKFTSDKGWTDGDFTGDGVTDVRDFNRWNAAKFTSATGPGPPTPLVEGQVPEPGTLALLASGVLGFLWIRRRCR